MNEPVRKPADASDRERISEGGYRFSALSDNGAKRP